MGASHRKHKSAGLRIFLFATVELEEAALPTQKPGHSRLPVAALPQGWSYRPLDSCWAVEGCPARLYSSPTLPSPCHALEERSISKASFEFAVSFNALHHLSGKVRQAACPRFKMRRTAANSGHPRADRPITPAKAVVFSSLKCLPSPRIERAGDGNAVVVSVNCECFVSAIPWREHPFRREKRLAGIEARAGGQARGLSSVYIFISKGPLSKQSGLFPGLAGTNRNVPASSSHELRA